MTKSGRTFNPPPGWPQPPKGWIPPKGWSPDASWPEPPPGWELWLPTSPSSGDDVEDVRTPTSSFERGPSIGRGSAAVASVDRRVADLEAENAALREQLSNRASVEVVDLDDERVLQEVGIYRYHHPLENAVAYTARLEELSARIASLAKASKAIEKSNMFTFDNSLAKGRKMTNDLATLMLRAYNAEADSSLRSLRVGNVLAAKKRLERSRAAIAKLGKMMEMRISDSFHGLRIEEIELTADFLMKKQEEREAAREDRARLREERKVQAELAEKRKLLDKERSHIVNALVACGAADADLERKLAEVDAAIAQNDYRAANIRAGYVYVISNRGALGDNVIKIGLTRRLEPYDRVHELGGASVPFRFDVHCLFFSHDAVTLEGELHQHFSSRRVNHANARKEFFFATPQEVRIVLESKLGNLLEFSERAESTEYLQSVRYWPSTSRTASPIG